MLILFGAIIDSGATGGDFGFVTVVVGSFGGDFTVIEAGFMSGNSSISNDPGSFIGVSVFGSRGDVAADIL